MIILIVIILIMFYYYILIVFSECFISLMYFIIPYVENIISIHACLHGHKSNKMTELKIFN